MGPNARATRGENIFVQREQAAAETAGEEPERLRVILTRELTASLGSDRAQARAYDLVSPWTSRSGWGRLAAMPHG